jgi:ABC-2 type transport system ATP-binding protein
MSRGVLGYQVSVRGAAGAVCERYIAKEELSQALREIQESGAEVTLIEPKRKSLEDFFLEMVRKGN